MTYVILNELELIYFRLLINRYIYVYSLPNLACTFYLRGRTNLKKIVKSACTELVQKKSQFEEEKQSNVLLLTVSQGSIIPDSSALVPRDY